MNSRQRLAHCYGLVSPGKARNIIYHSFISFLFLSETQKSDEIEKRSANEILLSCQVHAMHALLSGHCIDYKRPDAAPRHLLVDSCESIVED